MRAPVAQLDRAIASGAIGREFESLRARQQPSLFSASCSDSLLGSDFFRFGAVPNFAPTQPRHCIQNSILGRVNVAAGDRNRSVSRDAAVLLAGRRLLGVAVTAGGLTLLTSEYPEKFEGLLEDAPDSLNKGVELLNN